MTSTSSSSAEIRATGRGIMAGASVAICGLARDCAGKLPQMISQVERLGAVFESYRVIVVENDSSDETAKVLAAWRRRNERVRLVQFCYRSAPEEANTAPSEGGWFGASRMQRMVFARNQYLEALTEQALPDFVIIIDLDILSFSLAGVAHSFGLLGDWDVVTANGTRYSIRNPLKAAVYWDTYAYEPCGGFVDGVQTPGQIRSNQMQVAELLRSGSLVRALSAFGGLGIYRAELLKNHRYSLVKNDDPQVPVLCDHPTLHRSIRKDHKELRLMINPCMTVSYGTAMQLARQSVRRLSGKVAP